MRVTLWSFDSTPMFTYFVRSNGCVARSYLTIFLRFEENVGVQFPVPTWCHCSSEGRGFC